MGPLRVGFFKGTPPWPPSRGSNWELRKVSLVAHHMNSPLTTVIGGTTWQYMAPWRPNAGDALDMPQGDAATHSMLGAATHDLWFVSILAGFC